MQPIVYTLIINFHRCDKTRSCLHSLTESDYLENHIVVLNIGDTNKTCDLSQEFPMVEFLHVLNNDGYAGNNNFGLAYILSKKVDWVFILNEDTHLAPDCITELMNATTIHTDVGIVGPLVFHSDEPGIIQSAGGLLDQNWRPFHRGMNEEDNSQFNTVDEVAWVNGCGFLCNSNMMRQIH
ncbi:MAG TPA: glycosyltransferase, partial [Anaerolinea sp.]|nr:glycosyltransferase [Anaerolinea sp.]